MNLNSMLDLEKLSKFSCQNIIILINIQYEYQCIFNTQKIMLLDCKKKLSKFWKYYYSKKIQIYEYECIFKYWEDNVVVTWYAPTKCTAMQMLAMSMSQKGS